MRGDDAVVTTEITGWYPVDIHLHLYRTDAVSAVITRGNQEDLAHFIDRSHPAFEIEIPPMSRIST
jgi:hypothetical protein